MLANDGTEFHHVRPRQNVFVPCRLGIYIAEKISLAKTIDMPLVHFPIFTHLTLESRVNAGHTDTGVSREDG